MYRTDYNDIYFIILIIKKKHFKMFTRNELNISLDTPLEREKCSCRYLHFHYKRERNAFISPIYNSITVKVFF